METYYVRRKGHDTVEVDDENSLMIVSTDHSTVTRLNGTGSHCWNLLEQPQNADSLTRSLLGGTRQPDQEDADFLELRNDIQAFLDEMVQCGLIENER